MRHVIVAVERRERLQRDGDSIALARFEHHRGVGRRHADRQPGIARHRRQHQALQQPPGDDVPHLRIGHFLLLQEGLVGLVADLAVEPLHLRDLGDFRIDQRLRQMEAELVGERDQ